MLAWMLYAMLVASIVSIAALVAERGARLRGAPSRWIWMLALVSSLLIPAMISSVSVHVPEVVNRTASARVIPLRRVTSEHLAPTHWIGADTQRTLSSPTLETSALRSWQAFSATLLVLLLSGSAHLRWRKRRWHSQTVAGTPVWVAPDIGPAVVGLLKPHIVVPDWLLELPESHQATVIAHEKSHLEAGDPQALALALGILVCAPWNLPLWWQWRRLRYAIEVDCDSRLLKSGRDARSYGETLLAVGQRQSASIISVATMSEPRSFLEERITIMLRKPYRTWQLAAAALGCLSLALGAVATQVAPPEDPPNKQRVLVEVPPDVLDRYVGYYDYGGGGFVTVKREAKHLTIEFPGEPHANPVYPESATTFFYVNNDAQVSFATDASGQVATATLLQNGAGTPMRRIDAARADSLRVALESKVQRQAPSPGSEAMLQRLIAGILAGKPNLEEMNPQLAAAIGKDLPKLQVKLADLGAVQSMRLVRVNKVGMDVYEVKHERGSSEWSIQLSPSGTLVGAFVPL